MGRIEVELFSDGRLKVLRKHKISDSNVRLEGNEISICSRNNESLLEHKVLTAANLYNLTLLYPTIKQEFNKILMRYLGKTIDTLVS